MGVTECHEPDRVTALFEISHSGGQPSEEGWGISRWQSMGNVPAWFV